MIPDTVFQENSSRKFFNSKQQQHLFNQSTLKITEQAKLSSQSKQAPTPITMTNDTKPLINTKLNTNFNNYSEITKFLADNRKKREQMLSNGYIATNRTRKLLTYENLKKKINNYVPPPSYAW